MNDKTEYRITGIDIPFGDMVVFLVKAALAAIPAAIILSVIGLLVTLVVLAIGAAA